VQPLGRLKSPTPEQIYKAKNLKQWKWGGTLNLPWRMGVEQGAKLSVNNGKEKYQRLRVGLGQ
jgi:hypothetical protein